MSSKLTALTTNPSPLTTDLIYTVPAAGGTQYKSAISAYSLVVGPSSATSGAISLFNGTTGKVVQNSDLVYGGTTLSVPADFTLSSAASLQILPNGAGGVGIGTPGRTDAMLQIVSRAATTPSALWNTSSGIPTFSSLGEGTTGYGDSVFGFAAASGFGPVFIGRKARGTLASPAAATSGDRGFYITSAIFDGTSFLNSAAIQFDNVTVSSGVATQNINFSTSVAGSGSRAVHARVGFDGSLQAGLSNKSISAWGVTGPIFRVGALTLTDTSSSGTVATQAANSIATPTLVASSATTYTNSATLYIASAPTASTNVTQTNPWALWVDAGNVRLDGTIRTAAAVDWDFGALVTAAVVPDTTRYLAVTVGGVAYKVIIST